MSSFCDRLQIAARPGICWLLVLLMMPATLLADESDAKAKADSKPAKRPGAPDLDMDNSQPQLVRVVDENERPIAGAAVKVGWFEDEEGDSLHLLITKPPLTNEKGEVTIEVPAGTAKIQVSAEAEGYAGNGGQMSIAGTPVIKLRKGRIVKVQALDEAGKPLAEAHPLLEDSRIWGKEFQRDEASQVYISPVVKTERRLMRVVSRNEQGTLLFSDLVDVVETEQKNEDGVIQAVCKPGVRFEGVLGDSVPRPVKNGWVDYYIREHADHKILMDEHSWEWEGFTRVNEDGTFVIESLPGGGFLQLFILVEGHQSVSPNEEEMVAYFQKNDVGDVEKVQECAERLPEMWPQLFPLNAPVVQGMISCAPTCSIDVQVINPSGNPLPDAKVRLSPNGNFLGNLFIPGTGWASVSRFYKDFHSQEETRERQEWINQSFVSPEADENGLIKIRNMPGSGSESMDVEADGFVMPINPRSSSDWQYRSVSVEVEPGQLFKKTVTMERFIPLAEREVMVVTHEGNPVENIELTSYEISFADDPDAWETWSVQRLGSVVTGKTGANGRVVISIPSEVNKQPVDAIKLKVNGRITSDDYVRGSVVVPLKEDGGVILLNQPKKFRNPRTVPRSTPEYVDPDKVLSQPPQDLLAKLIETPSLFTLRQLLAANQYQAKAPLEFRASRNLLSYHNDRKPVAVIPTPDGERIVVMCYIRPQDATWKTKPELQSPPEAGYVFNRANGKLITVVGGNASAKGDWNSAMLVNLGGTDDYFIETSHWEEHEPFEQVTRWYHVATAENGPALTTWNYANSNSWNGENQPENPRGEFGYLGYEFNGEDILAQLPGLTNDAVAVPRKIYWDARKDTFIGPVQQAFGGRLLYRVRQGESQHFTALDPQPDDIIVAGGRRNYRNWHHWSVITSSSTPLELQLVLQSVNRLSYPKVLHQEAITRGALQNLQLEVRKSEKEEAQFEVEFRSGWSEQQFQQTWAIPAVSLDAGPSVDDHRAMRSVSAPVELYRRKTEDGQQELILKIVAK